MSSMKKIVFLSCITVLLIVASCRKEKENLGWDVDVAAPIISTSMSLQNMIADSLLTSNPDNTLLLVYNNTVFDFSLDSIVNLPDTISSQSFHLPVNITLPPGIELFNILDDKVLSIGSAKITDAIVRQGLIDFEVTNMVDKDVICTYEIPCATKNGITFQTTRKIPANSIGANIYHEVFDISGYTLNLRGPLNTKANILTTHVIGKLDTLGPSVFVHSTDSFIVNAKFNSILLNYVKGYFGNEQVSATGNSAFSIFNHIIGGTLDMEKIHVNLSITNGFGVDARLVINSLVSTNTHTGNAIALTSPLLGTAININRATEANTYPVPVNPSTYSFNMDNSNLEQLIENLPDQLSYTVNMETNPLGNTSCGNDFFYYNYGMKAALNMEIPLSFVANNLTLCDTVNYAISKPSNGSSLKSGVFKLIVGNGFPFETSVHIYILNPSNDIIDSLNISGVIAPGIMEGNKVVAKSRSIINIPITGVNMDRIYYAKKLKIVSRFNTANAPQYMKIYNNYTIDFKLTGDFKYQLHLK